MLKNYTTLDNHKELLNEKGYLCDEFKPPWKMSMWLKEFEEGFEQCRFDAHTSGEKTSFTIETVGSFNYHMDKVKFIFHYQYCPKSRTLSIKSLQARMAGTKKTYFLQASHDLPAASDVYQMFSERQKIKGAQKLFERLEKQNKPKIKF